MKTLIFLGIVCFLSSFSKTVFAQDCTDPHEQCGHEDSIGKVSSNTITDSDKAYVFGLGGGDMDINDCLATHSLLFGIWQGTHVNAMCEAARMDNRGDYQAAAEMRCSTKKYKQVYGKGQACVDAVIYVPPNNPEPDPAPNNEPIDYVAQQEYEDRIAALEELFDKQEAASQRAARQQQTQQQYEQKQVSADESRRAKAYEALQEGKQ